MRPVGAPEPLDRLVGAPAGLQQIVDAPLRVGAGQIGVIAAAGAAGHGEHQDALGPVHEGGGLGEIGRGRPRAQRQALALGIANPQHPARPAGDLGDRFMPEPLHDLVEGGGHRRQGGELLDQRVALGLGLPADDGVALGIGGGPAHQVAVVVGEGLLELHREGVHQEGQDAVPRREVDIEVAPFRGRNLGDAAFHQRLAGRDQLYDGGPAGTEIGLDGADQRGALHAGQQMAEEALLGALEGGQCRRLGIPVQRVLALDDAGGLQCLLDVLVDDLEGAGIGVVDAPLFGRQRVFEDFDLDPVIGERAGLVEAERLQVAGNHLHRGDAAGLHGGDELDPGLERGLAGGPEAEPPCIGETGDGGGASGRHIGDARVGQRVLKPQTGTALLGRLDLAALALRAGGVRHGMGFVEHDRAVEGMAVLLVERAGEPFDDLVEPRWLPLAGRRAKRGVGREEDALGKRYLHPLAEVAQGDDVALQPAERTSNRGACVLQQLVGLRQPEGALPAAQPVVQHDGGDLASLAAAGAVAQHPAPAEAHRVGQGLAVGRDEGGVNLLIIAVLPATMDGLPAGADAVLRGQVA